MIFYLLFMMGQWFLLGKEIDHRLKIYYRVNSSLDRVIYRILMGMCFLVLYFNLLALLPSKWIYNFYWITWVILGLFYSWPTRGKIIQESVSTNFTEFKFLDSFEKTLVGLIIGTLIISFPQLPILSQFNSLKLFFDPSESFSPIYWNFVSVHLYPFKGYPELFKISLTMHFYFIQIGLFLLALYSVLRYFVSRRLSLLGVFALLSSWSFSKIIAANFGDTTITTYSIFIIWSVLWCLKSGTYRSGLFVGLVGFYGSIISLSFAPFIFLSLILLYFYFLRDKTVWYRRQVLKYASFGAGLSLIILLTHHGFTEGIRPFSSTSFNDLMIIFNRKGFNSLAYLGVVIVLANIFFPSIKAFKSIQIDRDRLKDFLILVCAVGLYGTVISDQLIQSFSFMWITAIFCLFPIELIFQSISRLRSRRNLIYAIYIIICLLDSHLEGRVKIFIRLFET
jgi:hypothetical protein